MAKIPEYQRNQQHSPTLDIPTFSGGGGKSRARVPKPSNDTQNYQRLGLATQQQANNWTDLILYKKRQQDRTDIQAATNEYLEWDMNHFQDDVLSLTGADATADSLKALGKQKEQKIADIQKNLAPDLSEDFKNHITTYRLRGQKDGARHINNEKDKWNLKVQSDLVQNNLTQFYSIASSLDIDEMDERMSETVMPALEELATLQGIPVEGLKARAKQEINSKLIDQALANGTTGKARAMLDRYSKAGTISQDARKVFTARIRDEELNQEADELAAAWVEGGAKYSQVTKDIKDLKDSDLGKRARSSYMVRRRDQEIIAADAREGATIEVFEKINQFGKAGNLAGAQKFLRDLPEGAPKSAGTELLTSWRTGKADIETDIETYDKISTGIEAGKITTERQIVIAGSSRLNKEDLEEKVKQLKGTQEISDKLLKMPFANALGKSDYMLLEKDNKNDWYNFAKFARGVLKDSNRAKDPKHLQELADLWVLEGERKGWQPGYGKNMAYGEAVNEGRAEEWYHPEADTYFDKETPETQQKWLDTYGDRKQAILYYSQKLVKRNLGVE